MSKKKEVYAIWSADELAKTWNNIFEAEDVAEEAAAKHKSTMLIFKLVKKVEKENANNP